MRVPQQFHLDLHVDDLDEAAAYAESIGARRAANGDHSPNFIVFLDPSGHPFCLVLIAAPSAPTYSPYSEGMTKWEYVTVPLLVHATKQILDNWGQDGWELVQVIPGLNSGESRRVPQATNPCSGNR